MQARVESLAIVLGAGYIWDACQRSAQGGDKGAARATANVTGTFHDVHDIRRPMSVTAAGRVLASLSPGRPSRRRRRRPAGAHPCCARPFQVAPSDRSRRRFGVRAYGYAQALSILRKNIDSMTASRSLSRGSEPLMLQMVEDALQHFRTALTERDRPFEEPLLVLYRHADYSVSMLREYFQNGRAGLDRETAEILALRLQRKRNYLNLMAYTSTEAKSCPQKCPISESASANRP